MSARYSLCMDPTQPRLFDDDDVPWDDLMAGFDEEFTDGDPLSGFDVEPMSPAEREAFDLQQAYEGQVYLIASSNGYHKIGRSRDAQHRLIAIRSACPPGIDVSLVHVIDSGNAPALERFLHWAFGYRRVRGEWFELTQEETRLVSAVDWEASRRRFWPSPLEEQQP